MRNKKSVKALAKFLPFYAGPIVFGHVAKAIVEDVYSPLFIASFIAVLIVCAVGMWVTYPQ